jgi:hypothetical protein
MLPGLHFELGWGYSRPHFGGVWGKTVVERIEERREEWGKGMKDEGYPATFPAILKEAFVERNGHPFLGSYLMPEELEEDTEGGPRSLGPICCALAAWTVFFVALLLGNASIAVVIAFVAISLCGFAAVYHYLT